MIGHIIWIESGEYSHPLTFVVGSKASAEAIAEAIKLRVVWKLSRHRLESTEDQIGQVMPTDYQPSKEDLEYCKTWGMDSMFVADIEVQEAFPNLSGLWNLANNFNDEGRYEP